MSSTVGGRTHSRGQRLGDLRLARLRRAVLALSVLDDVDVEAAGHGVWLADRVLLPWVDVAAALGPWAAKPEHPVTRRRLRVAGEVMRLLRGGGGRALLDRVHAHAEPAVGSGMHPGAGWARHRLPGGALELGLGVSDLPGAPGPSPLPPLPSLRRAAAVGRRGAVPELPSQQAGQEPTLRSWPRLVEDLDRLAGCVVERLTRDAAEGRALVLRPTGTADVVTLLASRPLRRYVARADGTGLRALAVPVRTRGWFDLARIDAAYTGAAWSASDSLERAFARPVLVTEDEVTSPRPSGDVLSGVLADPAGTPRFRDVRLR